VKLTRPFLVVAVMLASVPLVGTATASGCPDDPERCVERGATVTHRTVAVAPATIATTAPAPVRIAPAVAMHKTPAPAASTHKASNKAARITPATPAPPTPGMGMLLKLSNGSGGEVSLFPSKATEKDNSAGVSWVL
jgi:hypothetical protein